MPPTCALDAECEDIAEDEELGEPIDADGRGGFCVRGGDDAAESHVYGSGEEGWRHEDEDGLEDVGGQ